MTVPPDPAVRMPRQNLLTTPVTRGHSPYRFNTVHRPGIGAAYPATRRLAVVRLACTGKLAYSLRRQAQVNDGESG